MAAEHGQFDVALARLAEAEGRDPERGTPLGEYRVALQHCGIFAASGQGAQAVSHGQRALELSSTLESHKWRVYAHLNLADAWVSLKELNAAETHLRFAIEAENDYHRRVGSSHMRLAYILYAKRDYVASARVWRIQAVEHYRRRYLVETARSLEGLAAALVRLGQASFAAQLAGAVDALRRRLGEISDPLYELTDVGADEARVFLGDAFDAAFQGGADAPLETIVAEVGAWHPRREGEGIWSLYPGLLSLPEAERRSASAHVEVVNARQPRVVFEAGQPHDGALYLVLRGPVERWDGARAVTVAPGTFVRDGALGYAKAHRTTLHALAGAKLLRLERRAWEASPTLTRLVAANEEPSRVVPSDAEGRVLNYLRGLAPSETVGWVEVALPLTQSELAARLGLARETVARALGRLEDAGLLTRPRRGHYRVCLSNGS